MAVSTASSARRADRGRRPGTSPLTIAGCQASPRGDAASSASAARRRRFPLPGRRFAATVHTVGFQPRTTEKLIAGWWEHARLAQGSRQQRKSLEDGDALFADAGWYGVGERVERGGVQALELVAAQLERAPDDDGVTLVAAGPLEDLLHRHGQELVDEIERWARQDFRFATALAACGWPTEPWTRPPGRG
jgi:hypothetical protein